MYVHIRGYSNFKTLRYHSMPSGEAEGCTCMYKSVKISISDKEDAEPRIPSG